MQVLNDSGGIEFMDHPSNGKMVNFVPEGWDGSSDRKKIGWIAAHEPAPNWYTDGKALKHHSNLLIQLIKVVRDPILGYVGPIDDHFDSYEESVNPDSEDYSFQLEKELLRSNMTFFDVFNFWANEMVRACP
jgi:hypothetical protein